MAKIELSQGKLQAMRLLVNSATQVIEEEGINALTIRRVSEKAGYSSANIYKYFKDFSQLVAYASINSIKDLINDLYMHTDESLNPIEMYMISWYVFTTHTFKRPEVYKILYMNFDGDLINYFDEYYSIFPDEILDIPEEIRLTFFSSDSNLRTRHLLMLCAEKGYIDKKYIDDIYIFTNAAFYGFFNWVSVSQGYSVELVLDFMKRILLSYNPELKKILDDFKIYPRRQR